MGPVTLSWGRAHRFVQARVEPDHRDEIDLDAIRRRAPNRKVLAHGMGRSYGDTPLNNDGCLIATRRLDRVIAADWEAGVVTAESGLTLDTLMQIAVPRGWFPKVTPGTKFVTLGGAIGSDIHGKNHHLTGSFGAHVTEIGLLRSDGSRLTLSPTENAELFRLTIGGLGLTGFIEHATIQLSRIGSSELEVENILYDHLDGFFDLCEDSLDWPYAVAWVDCFAPKKQIGRGVFSRGRFADSGPLTPHKDGKLVWPMEMPGFLLNKASITAFNKLYRSRAKTGKLLREDYGTFFYPLDGIRDWNLLYGRRGFFQHQSLLAPDVARDGLLAMLEAIAASGQGSFLAVLKNYGPERSPGAMTFGGEGFSLALDFANKGATTHALLDRLDDIVRSRGGRLYPAKDGRMDGAFFRESYPAWRELEAARDPAFSSSFWRRVAETA